jgi:nitrite reductase (NADH) small subunit
VTAVQTRAGQRIGPLHQIPVGEGRAFAVHGEQVAVFRRRDGRVFGLGAVCPHRGGPIADGQTDATGVVCPLHLNAFDFRTGCSSTSDYALPVYPVEVDAAGDIVVYPRATPGDAPSDPAIPSAADSPTQHPQTPCPQTPYPTSALDTAVDQASDPKDLP